MSPFVLQYCTCYGILEDYPSEEFHRIWKLMLLNQFHDILPGSCIKQVNIVSLHSGYFSILTVRISC